jgi:hypothetical protein
VIRAASIDALDEVEEVQGIGRSGKQQKQKRGQHPSGKDEALGFSRHCHIAFHRGSLLGTIGRLTG